MEAGGHELNTLKDLSELMCVMKIIKIRELYKRTIMMSSCSFVNRMAQLIDAIFVQQTAHKRSLSYIIH